MAMLIALLLAQAALTLAGVALIWRKLDAVQRDLDELRAAPPLRPSSARQRAAAAWRPRPGRVRSGAVDRRLLAAAAIVAGPLAGGALGLPLEHVVAVGLALAAAAMALAALRGGWTEAAWTITAAASGWALFGAVMGAAYAAPFAYSAAAGAGAGGLLLALRQRDAAPGSALAFAMTAALLALASQVGLASAAGAALTGLIAATACVGASRLRLEHLFVFAFAAALLALLVLSGQSAAEAWLTPAAALMGAAFLGIAVVRAPASGRRGATVAGVGALAAFAAVGAMRGASLALTDDVSAGAAMGAIAAALVMLIAVSAKRRGLAQLGVTLWMLAGAAWVAFAATAFLLLDFGYTGTAFMALALLLVAADRAVGNAVIRAFAASSALLSVGLATASARLALAEAGPVLTLIGAGVGGAAIAAWGASALSPRERAPRLAAGFDLAAVLLTAIAAGLVVRYGFSGGALRQAVSVLEAQTQACAFGLVALLAEFRRDLASRVAASVLLALGVGACAVGFWLWLSAEGEGAPPAPAGFAIATAVFLAHWVVWRARGEDAFTRTAFATAAINAAGFVAVLLVHAQVQGWPLAGAAALAFTAATLLNFAPGVTRPAAATRAASRTTAVAARTQRQAVR